MAEGNDSVTKSLIQLGGLHPQDLITSQGSTSYTITLGLGFNVLNFRGGDTHSGHSNDTIDNEDDNDAGSDRRGKYINNY